MRMFLLNQWSLKKRISVELLKYQSASKGLYLGHFDQLNCLRLQHMIESSFGLED